MLVSYFSWGGNTRRIAEEINSRVGGDIFEIAPAKPYSSDYDKCVDESHAEKRSLAKVELKELVDKSQMAKHKVVFVGYPNWLQSIPRPVATFLEAYDWSGKVVMPFCSHGGGRLGQTHCEIVKLCAKAKIASPLVVLKGGGDNLGEALDEWLAGGQFAED